MPVRGIGAYFALTAGNTSPLTLTNISSYLDNIQGSSAGEKLDTTVFQPNISNPLKTSIPGSQERGYTLTGKWSSAAEAFFSAIEGLQNLEYEYGPEGTNSGKKKIYGHCGCVSYSGPQSSVTGITPFTVELAVVSRNVGVY